MVAIEVLYNCIVGISFWIWHFNQFLGCYLFIKHLLQRWKFFFPRISLVFLSPRNVLRFWTWISCSAGKFAYLLQRHFVLSVLELSPFSRASVPTAIITGLVISCSSGLMLFSLVCMPESLLMAWFFNSSTVPYIKSLAEQYDSPSC